MIKEFITQLAKGLVRKSNKVEWKNLRSLKPVSGNFGFIRGTPVDRYYIEKFLADNKKHIHGRVLEVAESLYSKKFNGGVEQFETLGMSNENSDTTIIGDLTVAASLPSNSMDCFICTQTFNFIYEIKKAVAGSYQLLKPGGVMLVTVAGVCQVSRYDMERWGDYWRFTDICIQKLFAEVFPEKNIRVKTYGNVLSATALLHGISAEELTPEELDVVDNNYQVVISIIAEK